MVERLIHRELIGRGSNPRIRAKRFKTHDMDESLVMRYQLRLLALSAQIIWLAPMCHPDSLRLSAGLKLSVDGK